MSKKTTQKSATFAVNDRVFVRTAATLDTTATGTIEATTKTGWFVVRLDESNSSDVLASAKGGKVSARASSLSLIADPTPAPAGSIAGMLAAATAKPAPKAKPEPKAKATPKPVAPKLPTECPECESGELEVETDPETGTTTVSCSCGWEETIEDESKAEMARRMAEALRQARAHYTKDKRPDGSATAHCGDAIARELRDYDPKEVAELADKVLQQPVGTHYDKYRHLNNGQIRMNSGNRIRAEWKRVNEEGDEANVLRIAKLLNLVEIDDAEEASE